ncbi:MAG TPA: amino acid adenylation domain-containing protein [Pyrinomonadaceae bacterium]|jgi:amino acid adenylation domain-containing protein
MSQSQVKSRSSNKSGNVEDIYLLSPLQEGLLFHSLYSPETDSYLQQLRFTIRGGLDVQAFEHAWQRVIERHPILRTGFVWERQEKPLQVVRRSVKLPWTELDWRGLSRQEQQERFVALLEEDRLIGFDFAKAPLLRMTVVRMADDVYELFCTLHHLLTDGWSTSILIKEIFAYYNAAAEGREPQLARPRPYRDYIDWLSRQDLAEAEQFWRGMLGGFNVPTPLIADPSLPPAAPAAAVTGTEIQRAWLSPATTERLQALARRNGITLNTLVLGAWSLLLSRYSGEPDVVFGVTTSGRPASLAGVETMVGCFINTLPIRVQLPPDARLMPWLAELQHRLLEICEHEYSPLVQVHGYSDVPRGVPLFESMVVFENYPLEATTQDLSRRLEGVAVHSVERSNFPLGLVAAPGPKLYLQLGYDPGRFSYDTAGRMLAHLEAVLENIEANPEQRLADVSLLTAAERYQLLTAWNATARAAEDEETGEDWDADACEPWGETCLHRLFEEQVERTPEALAVVSGDERLTYGELNRRADQLAHYLRGRGIGAEGRVGICVERSAEMIVGLLGILKAGGAYVPLDPTYPADRLGYMIEDAGVSVLLTQKSLLGNLPADAAREGICLDADWELIAAHAAAAAPEHNAHASALPGNTAYVIYTSGSTGQPKGVLVPHRGICNTLLWRREAFTLGGADRILQNLSFAFDASVWQIFGALVSGAQLVLTHAEDHRDSASLIKMIVEHGITITDFPPSLLKVFLSENGVEKCRSLRHVFCGGEAMTRELQEQFFARLDADLHNVYGPTEASVDATCWTCRRDDERPLIPIGRPICNKQMYVLDAELQPVPVGVSGELYIGGAGLAHGYVRRPDATAERFIPHPFSTEPGARLYRTGDVGRYLPDGAIQFVGRNDQQVKVRGFRIELGEIESALVEHPAVQECVVIARDDDASGNKTLVAYAVAETEAGAVAPGVLRIYLKEKLPEYMCPSAFVMLESLPLNANGKIDRRRLPAPTEADWEQGENFVRPRTLVEELLAEIWAQVLGVKRVGLNDNFFELGGHSLLATRIVSKAREAFHIELSLRALFEKPTVAGLSAVVEAEMKRAQQGTPTPPLLPVPRDGGGLPMSFAQQRLWFLDRLVPGNAFYNLHEVYRIKGQLHVPTLVAALNEIVKRHEILRTTLVEDEGRLLQVVSPAATLELPLVSLEDLPEERDRQLAAARLAREDAQRPFNLSEDMLLRTTLVRLGAEDHRLILTMHHIVTDGWSMGILLRELIALYQAFSAGRPSPLPELAVQYADFSQWQQDWLCGEVLETELSYWREQLAAAPPALVLPTDRPRPATQSFSGATHRFQLDEALARELVALSRREGATLFMTLLAAFNVLLARYSGQDDILVGTPVANRNRVEVEHLIGFFVNTLVLRTRLEDGLSFRRLVRQVREVCLGAYAHQEVPFEKLVEELHPERSLSHHPLFQVMFTADHAPAEEAPPEGLTLGLIGTNDETAKFDLTFSFTESDQGLSGAIEYNTDLFDAATVARMSNHFRQLLEAIIDNPDMPVSRLPLLAEDEQRQLLVEWNDTAATYPDALCVHQLFKAQAARTPEQIAVIADDEQLSYAELDERSDKLAHYLRGVGVAPEVTVAVCMPRSAGMVVALLGILKAGGTYVPLDPQYPRERLIFMLEDADTAVLLMHKSLSHLFEGDVTDRRKLVCVDTDWDTIVCRMDDALANDVELMRNEWQTLPAPSPDNAAYIIYTSGSTGRPKGVPVTHRALVNHNFAVSAYYELEARDRVLHFSSITFDVAAEELFPTLLIGASVVLRADDVARSIAEFKRFVRRHEVTVVNLPTPFWHEWVAAMGGGERSLPETLRLVVIGSDRASVDHYATWQRVVGERIRLVNAYGPTEATITATAYEAARPGDDHIADSVPIGRPLANMEIYVLDGHLQPVPTGVTGEIYIGGTGLARGYLNRTDLTAERFIPHPFSTVAGARLYKTGDCGRYLPDGTLKIVGRVDEQVKVRGYRIELSEIEAVLGMHPAIKETVVLASETAAGDRRVVAYVVADQTETSISADDLRTYMKEKLPEYMVPSAFVLLDELPLTPNGKVDRRALPAPDLDRAEAGGSFIAPRDFLEQPLIKIWENVLGVKPIGVTDNFFDLGGHSLLALRLMGEIQQQFGRELPLAILFEQPTVEHLARALQQQFETLPHSPLVPLQPHGTRRPLFFVHVGSGQVLCYLELARQLGTDQPFYGLQDTSIYAPEGDEEAVPDIPIEKMAAYYIESLRAVQPAGPYLLGGWSFGGLIAYEMAVQLTARGEDVPLLFLIDTGTPEFIRELGAEDDTALLGILAREMSLPVTDDDLRPLSQEEQLRLVVAEMEKARLVFDDSLAYLRRQLDIFKSRVRVMHAYHPPQYGGRIIFFSASETNLEADLMPLALNPTLDPMRGFGKLATGSLELHTVPGTHNQLARGAGAAVLAEMLRSRIDREVQAEPLHNLKLSSSA